MVLNSQRYGRWIVLDDSPILTSRGERKWLCRCDCGTERYVLERTLVHNGSKSCGCLRKEKVRDSLGLDLRGKTFGDLTVLHIAERRSRARCIYWTCRCSCGALYDVPGTLLHRGRRTHCPDLKAHPKRTRKADITGQRFGRLVALSPTSRRSGGNVVWKCRCDCGKKAYISYNALLYANVKSCGCQKKEHNEKLHSYLTHVAGTSIDAIKSRNLPSNNTTGYKGVYLIRGKYAARIVFQKRSYNLGTYEDVQTAALARQHAEELLFTGTIAYYERWNARAAIDPEWAKANPVKISVVKDQTNGLVVTYSPEL